MHRRPGRDPLEPDHAPHDHVHVHAHAHGRNDAPAQWQTPHLHDHHHHEPPQPDEERDLDLVEQAFVDGFGAAADPTSFLRLAGVPFEGVDAEGRRLALLRVERDQATDIGAITPRLGGGAFRYDPLPAKMTTRRDRLRFIYFDGAEIRALGFAEARALTPVDQVD